jgi:hypothetical protein
VQQVAVEKEGITRLQFAVNQLHPLQCGFDPLQIRRRLCPGFAMIDSPHSMRSSDDLQAAIFLGGLVQGDQATGHIREQATIVVPVAVILMPGPGSPDLGILQNHLGVIMVNFLSKDLLDPVNDPATTRHHPINSIPGMIPQGKPDIIALAIIHGGGRLIHGMIVAGGFPEKTNFLLAEQPAHEEVAITIEILDLITGKDCHGFSGFTACWTLLSRGGSGKLLVYSQKITIFFKSNSWFPFEAVSQVPSLCPPGAGHHPAALSGRTRGFHPGRSAIAQ